MHVYVAWKEREAGFRRAVSDMGLLLLAWGTRQAKRLLPGMLRAVPYATSQRRGRVLNVNRNVWELPKGGGSRPSPCSHSIQETLRRLTAWLRIVLSLDKLGEVLAMPQLTQLQKLLGPRSAQRA